MDPEVIRWLRRLDDGIKSYSDETIWAAWEDRAEAIVYAAPYPGRADINSQAAVLKAVAKSVHQYVFDQFAKAEVKATVFVEKTPTEAYDTIEEAPAPPQSKPPRHCFSIARGKARFCATCGIHWDRASALNSTRCIPEPEQVMARVEKWIGAHMPRKPRLMKRLEKAEKGRPVGPRFPVEQFPRRYGWLVNEWQLRGVR